MNTQTVEALRAKFGLSPTGPQFRQRMDGKVMDASGTVRCRFSSTRPGNNTGRSSLIQRAIRTQGSESRHVAIKRPRDPRIDLTNEALIQHLVHQALVAEGLPGAAAEVFDIFRNLHEIHFSMEWVEGQSIERELEEAIVKGNLDEVLLDCIRQLAAIFQAISHHLYFDHRDMSTQNVWVRAAPMNYRVRVGNFIREISSRRQIVLLDFGFACLGNAGRIMGMNLGGAIPETDWCPKPGRDMYVIVNQLLAVRGVWEAISPEVRDELVRWMGMYGPSNVYKLRLDTDNPQFDLPSMKPEAILARLLNS